MSARAAVDAVSAQADRGRAALRGGQVGVLAALLGLAGAAWLISDLRMAGMDAGPGTDPGALSFYMTTWIVMMAAMMFPSIAPMVLTYRALHVGQRRRAGSLNDLGARRSTAGPPVLFVAGYLVVWAASGLLAYAAFRGGRALASGWFGWHHAGRWVAAGVLAAAAVYELTPWKTACLVRCRSPLSFLVSRWRPGPTGAARMGLEHGAWCLGCCWLLMVGLFALGVMSVAWMLVIAALIALEKLLPRRRPGIAVVAVALGALAIGVAAAPEDVPALTIPGSQVGMAAMPKAGTRAMHTPMAPMPGSAAAPKSAMR